MTSKILDLTIGAVEVSVISFFRPGTVEEVFELGLFEGRRCTHTKQFEYLSDLADYAGPHTKAALWAEDQTAILEVVLRSGQVVRRVKPKVWVLA